MTKEQFDEMYLHKAVHCDTLEKAEKFLQLAHSFGYRGSNYVWEVFGNSTCYYIFENGYIDYSYKNWCLNKGYKVVGYQPEFCEKSIRSLSKQLKKFEKEFLDKKAQKENDWKNRLRDETLELAKKYNALQDYMRTKAFYELPRVDKDLLYEQSHHMLSYLQVLGKRCELHGIDLGMSLLPF